MTTSQNLFPSDPDWPDTFNLFRKDVFLGLNCHAIGVIESFNSVLQTAQVSIVYTKTFFEKNPAGTYVPVQKYYPLLVDAPVIFPGGGGWALTWPVAEGDECLVFFNDRDIDNWWQGNQGAATASLRLHSFADALILVGLRSKPNVVTSFNATSPEIRNEDASVKFTMTDNGDFTCTNSASTLVLGHDGSFTVTHGGNTLVLAANGNFTVTNSPGGVSFTNAGKFSVTNSTGEFVAALIQFFQTATAGGYPIVGDLSTLQSFKA